MTLLLIARPPLTEGHHVGGRIKDVVGRDPSENLQKDCKSI